MGYTAFLIVQSRRQSKAAQDEFAAEMPADSGWDRHWSVQVGLVGAGLVLARVRLRLAGHRGDCLRHAMGVSDVVIGLTVVAAGTSMPEVATSITAAIKGERDIAVGNVVGSNNVQHPRLPRADGHGRQQRGAGRAVDPDLRPVGDAGGGTRLPADLHHRPRDRTLGRRGCSCWYYAAYTVYLILAAQQHDALPVFSRAMLLFVIPMTVVALAAAFLRSRRASV